MLLIQPKKFGNKAAERVQKRSDCAATRLLTTLFTGEAIVTHRSCKWRESGLNGIGTRRATVEVKDLTKITQCPSLSKI